ncbi:hypothetical protein C3747_44g95 [Trypanosoma cruzi]|uniref:Nodulin-like domain-containing protein n=2 Tax=Trypanosoma cruzi TaxID=5693 RepID=Q4CSY7_TRYCC|nr:hypothetical protein, conserved [Trypanosoma cruzi]EAN83391.1 hypothetical protein, conserved [Trypanosoma cruzi]PWV13293.1 hypothetical protein C3747_44g95 [Trypanosoma cruzi]RNC60617.1 putative membrane transporter [Trypanosoma cruzi]|eukprot:XP_805242.1 hypothetical protein [Trypanosoma cruzi strain CL Brener]
MPTTVNSEDIVQGYVEKLVSVEGQKPLTEWRRFGALVAGTFAAICASTAASFNLFSGALQQKYSFRQRDISAINTVGMVFCFFLLPYGAIYDHFGPRPIYVLACVLLATGALLFGLSFGDHIEGSTVRFCVYNAMLSLGSELLDMACGLTLLSIFPTNRGGVVAFLKTLLGLGSAILGSFYLGFFNGHPDYYFYFIIVVVLCVCSVVVPVVRLPSYHLTGYEQRHLDAEEKERRLARKSVYLRQKAPFWRFLYGLVIVFVLIVYLPTQSALVAYLKLDRTYQLSFAIVAAVMTLMLPLMAVPCGYLDRKHMDNEGALEPKKQDETRSTEGTLPNRDDAEGKEEEKCTSLEGGSLKTPVETDIDYIAPQYQTTFMQSICTLKLWAFFWTFFCGVGSEFVIIYNARFILGAISGERVDDAMGALLTVLNGVGSAAGRLLMSYFEVWSQKRKAEDRIPITISLFVPTMCIILSLLLFLVLSVNALLLAFAIAALGNGFCASVSILVVRTIYAKDPAKHYNFALNSLWLAAIILNRFLYGEWYAREAERHGEILCYGKSCVLMPMLVMLGLNVTGMISTIYVHLMYSRFSRMVVAERRLLRMDSVEPLGGEMAEVEEPRKS